MNYQLHKWGGKYEAAGGRMAGYTGRASDDIYNEIHQHAESAHIVEGI